MASEEIVCGYVYTVDEYRRARKGQLLSRKVVAYFARLFALIIVIFFLVRIANQSRSHASYPPHVTVYTFQRTIAYLDNTFLLCSLSILIFLAFLLLIAFTRILPKNFSRSVLANQPMTIALTDETLAASSPLINSVVKWEAFESARENISGFVLSMYGTGSFYWLPKSGFTQPNKVDECRLLLRQKVKDTHKLFAD